MNHISVEDALVQELLENAAWSQIGKELILEEQPVKGAEKVDEGNMFGNEDQEVISEDAETEEGYACPMCESSLEEPLPDDHIMEAVNRICDVIDELNEEALSEDTENADTAEEDEED